MKNISWRTKIATLYISFVVLVIIMVTISMNQKIDLVSSDYYKQELAFQNRIEEVNNANSLIEKISYKILDNTVEFQFPSQFKNKKVFGTILFFKPSDASKDIQENLILNEKGIYSIKSDLLSKGMYKVQISWNCENTPYFNEQIIVIP